MRHLCLLATILKILRHGDDSRGKNESGVELSKLGYELESGTTDVCELVWEMDCAHHSILHHSKARCSPLAPRGFCKVGNSAVVEYLVL